MEYKQIAHSHSNTMLVTLLHQTLVAMATAKSTLMTIIRILFIIFHSILSQKYCNQNSISTVITFQTAIMYVIYFLTAICIRILVYITASQCALQNKVILYSMFYIVKTLI